MNVSIFSDPVKIGPGIWFKMHIDAIEATNDERKKAFITNVNALCDNFKCVKCQLHFRKFIDSFSLENYWNIHDDYGRDIGFFKWTWELHNAVNKFLGKYQPTLQESYDFYSSPQFGACFNCGNGANNNITLPEQRSRAIPPILTLYRKADNPKAHPFQLAPKY